MQHSSLKNQRNHPSHSKQKPTNIKAHKENQNTGERMLEMHIPTIEKHSEKHADWYKGFSIAFNLCQLSNNLLLSYLRSYIETNSREIILHTDEFRQNLKKCKDSQAIEDLIYSLDIQDFLKQIVQDFSEVNHRHTEVMYYSGIHIKGFHNTEVDIDLDELINTTSEESWNKAIRGILNVFEFIYLFSITEDHLKDALNERKSPQLVGRALNTTPGLSDHLKEEFKLPRDFIHKTWDFFVEIRNIYSHSFGYLQEKDKEKIIERREKLIDAHDKLPMIFSLTGRNLEEFFFVKDKLNIGKMYLLNDQEVNLFRNFIRIFIPEFAKMEHAHRADNGAALSTDAKGG